MRSRTIQPFWRLYHALPDEVQDQADKAFDLFEQNPFHPSLRFKQVNKRRKV
jgi:hypothetical protein